MLHVKILAFLLLCAGILIVCTSFRTKAKPKEGVKTVVIDAGHGGKDPGCNGLVHNEKDVTLAVALKLGKLIEENIKDVKVIYTRKTDVFVELEERAQVANRNEADLFISIHCNAASTFITYTDKKGKKRKREVHNPKPYGSETYVMGIKNEKGKLTVAKRENAAMLLEDNYAKTYNGFDPNSDEAYIIMSMWTGAFVEQSADFASKIQEEYVKKAGRIDKGVQRQSIWVLWRTAMPSILTEVGFLTNPEEEKFLGSAKGQKYLATSIFRAFRKYKDEKEGRTGVAYNDEFETEEALVNENYLKGDSLKMVKNTKVNSDSLDTDVKIPEEEVEDEKYNILIAEANLKEKEGKLTEAKFIYGKASEMHPKEKFPLEKIEEIDRTIAAEIAFKEEQNRMKAEKERETKYKNYITEAEKKFNEKKYAEAQKFYLKAVEVHPEDTLSKHKINELETTIVAEKARVEEENRLKALQDKESRYRLCLLEAEKKTNEKKYTEAKGLYLKAATINTSDTISKQKIEELDQLIVAEKTKEEEENKLRAAMDKEGRYKSYLAGAEKKTTEKKYAEAKIFYMKAAEENTNDTLCKHKIAELDNLIATEKAKEEEENRLKAVHEKESKYKWYLTEAEKKSGEKKYTEAKNLCLKAAEYSAADTLYKIKLLEIDHLIAAEKTKAEEDQRLAEEKEKDKKYNWYIAEGDKKAWEKKFIESKSLYYQALQIKPTDLIAKKRLNEVDAKERLAEKTKTDAETSLKLQKEKEAKYKWLIKVGDTNFAEKKYHDASVAYAKALLLKPHEMYPLQKGEECTKLLKEHKPGQEQPLVPEQKNNKDLASNDLIRDYKNNTEKGPNKDNATHTQHPVNTIHSQDGIVFRVQFTANETEIPAPGTKFNTLESIWFYKMNGMYKYTAGKFMNHDEALKYQEKVRSLGYPGAFIVAFNNDKRIEMNQAVKLAKQ